MPDSNRGSEPLTRENVWPPYWWLKEAGIVTDFQAEVDAMVERLRVLPIGYVAHVQGAAMQMLASDQGLTEAQMYEEWARRAAVDLDCHVLVEPLVERLPE